MKAQLVCDALSMAIWQRKPKAGLIIHSDQGVQYASHQYRRILRLHKFVGSMSKKGRCWDNAVAKSFFGSFKQEQVHWRNYRTRYAAQQDVLNYITMWYNRQQMHSYLNYQSPNEFERMTKPLKEVAELGWPNSVDQVIIITISVGLIKKTLINYSTQGYRMSA
jgi:putative transposase